MTNLVNMILEDVKIHIPIAATFDAGQIQGTFDCGRLCPKATYSADVSVQILDGVCAQTSISLLSVTPIPSNDTDILHGLDVVVKGIKTHCTFTTIVTVSNVVASTGQGVTVGVIVETPPETPIDVTVVNINVTQRVYLENKGEFGNNFQDTRLVAGPCKVEATANSFQWSEPSLPMTFKLRLLGSYVTVYENDYGVVVTNYLETDAADVIVPALQDELCPQLKTALEDLDDTLRTFPLPDNLDLKTILVTLDDTRRALALPDKYSDPFVQSVAFLCGFLVLSAATLAFSQIHARKYHSGFKMNSDQSMSAGEDGLLDLVTPTPSMFNSPQWPKWMRIAILVAIAGMSSIQVCFCVECWRAGWWGGGIIVF
jgi:hypothetical protein